MTTNEKTLLLHEEWEEKPEITSKAKVASKEDLILVYIPGIAESCKVITAGPEAIYRYTIRSNTAVIVPDGDTILDLGNIGSLATMSVMKDKAVSFREFGGANAFPVCLNIQDTQEIIETIVHITLVFGGIDLKGISAPGCFKMKEALEERLDIPMFHNDQHGITIVVLAGVISVLRLTDKKKEDCRVIVNDTDSAGIAITKLLLTYGFPHVTTYDKNDILSRDTEGLNWVQEKMTDVTSLEYRTGTLIDAIKGAGIFAGISAPGIITQDMVASTNKDAILLAMTNPVPEIMSDLAKAAGACVVGAGRSDFPNRINNVVVFPGIFKGTPEGRTSTITGEMKLAAAEAITGLVDEKDLSDKNILPEAFDPRVADVVSNTVKDRIRK